MPEEDRRDLQTFIDELQRLLQDVASETRHPHLLSPDRREDLRTALGALSNFFGDVRHALDDPVVDTQPTTPGKYSLENAQLTGEPRRRKIGGFRQALDRFRNWPTRKSLSRVFRWANMLLESLAEVVPGAATLKELKQYAENLNADAMEDAAADPG
jgi:hypothetical protein